MDDETVSGSGQLLVGYREHSRRRLELIDRFGVDSVAIKPCVADCGYPVFFVDSGVQTYRKRDPDVICEECFALYRPQVEAEL